MPPSASPSSPPQRDTGALAGRLRQLAADGLLDHFRSARPLKTQTFAAARVGAPRALLKGINCKTELVARHDRLAGALPAAGLFELHDCAVGKGGTLIDAERKVLYDDDLVSSYWLWMVGRQLAPVGDAAVGATGRHLAGQAVPEQRAETGAATLVSLCWPGAQSYGHWLLDALPAAWHLFEAVRLGLIAPPFRFVVNPRTPAWARRLLAELFDIDASDLLSFDDDATVLRAERLIVPSLLHVGPLLSPHMNDFVRHVTDRFALAALPARSGLPSEFFIVPPGAGSAAAEALASDCGLAPLRPETLPWVDQLKLFSRATLVAGADGGGLHNLLFSPASTVGVVLLDRQPGWAQSGIAALRDQQLVCLKPADAAASLPAPADLGAALALARSAHAARLG